MLEWSAELAQNLVACVQNKLKVGSAALLVENEDELVLEANPVEEHHCGSDKLHVMELGCSVRLLKSGIDVIFVFLFFIIGVVVPPDDLEDADKQIAAPL